MNNSGKRLLAPFNRFPTSKHDYTIVTPMMEDVFDIVSSEVDKMENGISLYATSRFGKTRAMDYIEDEMHKQSPSVTVERVIMTTRTRDSDKRFFGHFLSSLSPDDDLLGDGDQLRSKIVRFLLMQCSERQDPRLLFMIDEAQRMTARNFSFLIDLTNQLERLGVSPTVLLVGQPELLDRRDELLTQKRKDAVGRFLDSPISLEGVTSVEPMKPILRQYDDNTKVAFPPGTKNCITAAYVSDLYKKGLRLEHAAEPLWKAFKASASALKTKPVVGMRNLTRAIEMGLTELAISGNADDALNHLWWKQILLESGYLRHLKTISDPGKTQ